MSDIAYETSDIGTQMSEPGCGHHHIRHPISILHVGYDIVAMVSFCLKQRPIVYMLVVSTRMVHFVFFSLFKIETDPYINLISYKYNNHPFNVIYTTLTKLKYVDFALFCLVICG